MRAYQSRVLSSTSADFAIPPLAAMRFSSRKCRRFFTDRFLRVSRIFRQTRCRFTPILIVQRLTSYLPLSLSLSLSRASSVHGSRLFSRSSVGLRLISKKCRPIVPRKSPSLPVPTPVPRIPRKSRAHANPLDYSDKCSPMLRMWRWGEGVGDSRG